MHHVGHHVHLCLLPGDEFSVVPDVGGGLDRHVACSVREQG